jgi:hypothetical protein
MSTQVYSSHSQTRQELDELDALLQRMLDLPMNSPTPPAEPFSAVASAPFAPVLPSPGPLPRLGMPAEPMPAAWRMTQPSDSPPPAAPTPTAAEAPFASEAPYAPAGVGLESPTHAADAPFASEAPYPYSMIYGQPVAVEALPPFAEPIGSQAYEPPPYAAPVWAQTVPSREEPSRSFLLMPIVVLNGVFDALTYLLGPLGAWLRRGSGRTALGWLGIVMILGAIAWALADWADWIQPAWTQ